MAKSGSSTLRLWAEEGTEKTVTVASVVPISPLDKTYSFAVPDHLIGQLSPGRRVKVPFGKGNRSTECFVLDISQRTWSSTLKYLDSVVDSDSLLGPELIELGRWMARYYCTPLGLTLSAMVPAAAKRHSGYRSVRYIQLNRRLDDIMRDSPRLGKKQRRLLEGLPPNGEEVQADLICDQLEVSKATLRSTIQKQWVDERVVKQPQPAPDFDQPLEEPSFTVNADQQKAIDEVACDIDAREFRVILLYGVSGSGKTEVYIEAMKKVVARGRQVIVLVPEIALTTQLVHRFAVRFTNVAIIHSGLTDLERSLTWNAIKTGKKRVIIGTRSAIFAPCENLGLIVIDEEQEPSFKNLKAPRFHARDAGIKRAQIHRIPILLGSATPALETWYNCQTKSHYRRIHLDQRVAGLAMPKVELVDMGEEERIRPGLHLLSRLLEKRLAETLANNEQAVLLLNRRGYASVLYCPRCKIRVVCPNCKASMVFHRTEGLSICHHCYLKMPAPSLCADPSCRTGLTLVGMGTERAEAEIKRKFPHARVKRMDSDTMENVHEYEKVISTFEKREIDIIIGTQMVAKGLDFPFVSLVGVVSADTSLYVSDFRVNERTFQLVTQVAGRAGRAHTAGRVVVQTLMSNLPALQVVLHHDYESFAARELKSRQELRMPPYCRLTRWILSDQFESKLKTASEAFANTIRQAIARLGLADADVIGAFPSPLERIRKRYRYDVLLRTPNAEQRMQLLDYLRQEKLLKTEVQRVVVDVDPVSLL